MLEKNFVHLSVEPEGGLLKSLTSSSISSGPIAIPGSPARRSPSRQSSRDSLEGLEEVDEGENRYVRPRHRQCNNYLFFTSRSEKIEESRAQVEF